MVSPPRYSRYYYLVARPQTKGLFKALRKLLVRTLFTSGPVVRCSAHAGASRASPDRSIHRDDFSFGTLTIDPARDTYREARIQLSPPSMKFSKISRWQISNSGDPYFTFGLKRVRGWTIGWTRMIYLLDHCHLNDDDLCNCDSVRRRNLTMTYDTNHCSSIGTRRKNKFQPCDTWSFNVSNGKLINRNYRMFSILVRSRKEWKKKYSL